MRMTAFAILLTIAAVGINPDSAAALADRDKLALTDQPYAYYLSLSSQRSPEARERLVKVVRTTLPSLSRKTYLGEQLPVRVNETLLRIDTRGLGWEESLPHVLATHYPYRPDLRAHKIRDRHGRWVAQHPLVFDAAWFVASVTDPIITGDSQYRLIYGKPPKTTAEFRKFWQVGEDPQYLFQFHEANSGVGVNPDRNVQQRDTAIRTFHWATQDSEFPVGDKDPGNYGKPLKFDAGEEFAGMPKQLAGAQGAAIAWWLGNGKGQRQEVAPARIVTDKNAIASTEIRNTKSCKVCHVEGVRPLTKDGFREFRAAGARVALDKHAQLLVDQQYQAGVAQQVEADNQQFAKFLEMCNGSAWTPGVEAVSYEKVVRAYDAPLTREQAARELYLHDDEFRLALGAYSKKYSLPRRLAGLAEGLTISRAQWITDFHIAWEVRSKWPELK